MPLYQRKEVMVMKCPHCDQMIDHPLSSRETMSEIDTLIVYCPACLAILGIVNVNQK